MQDVMKAWKILMLCLLFCAKAIAEVALPTPMIPPTPPHAPIHVLILTSLSCPHCAKTADETKKMIEKFVKEGRITAEWGDFPNDLATLVATKLTYAFGPSRRYELYRVFLSKQDEWHSVGWKDKIRAIATSLNIPKDIIEDAFLEASTVEEGIIERLNKLLKNKHFKIDYVPVLIVDDKYLLDVEEGALEKKLKEIEQERQRPHGTLSISS